MQRKIQVWRVAKLRSGWVQWTGDFRNLIKIRFFLKFLLKAHYYPAYYITAE